MSLDTITFIFIVIAFLVVLPIHEAAHAWAAHMLGDDTAKLQGRLTLNPLKHLDPIGTIMLLSPAHFGWGKPVPINTSKFENPRMGYFLSSLAGPMSNLALAAVLVLIQKYILSAFSGSYIDGLQYFVSITVYLSVLLMVFNLIPIPPLDGSKIWYIILPPEKQEFIFLLEKNGPMFLLIAILAGRFMGLNLFGWLGNVTEFILSILYFTT